MRFDLATACATANAFVLFVNITNGIGVVFLLFLESLQNKVSIHDITVTCIFYFLSSISGHFGSQSHVDLTDMFTSSPDVLRAHMLLQK